jgi:hypothetical protein
MSVRFQSASLIFWHRVKSPTLFNVGQAGDEECGQKSEIKCPPRLSLPRQADHGRGEHRLRPFRLKDTKKMSEQVTHHKTDQYGI